MISQKELQNDQKPSKNTKTKEIKIDEKIIVKKVKLDPQEKLEYLTLPTIEVEIQNKDKKLFTLLTKAKEYYLSEQFTEALESYDELINLHSRNYVFHHERASVLVVLEKYDLSQ